MMSTGYTPNTDDVFHAVGYTSRDILQGGQFRLLDLSRRVMMENEKLWKQLGPLAAAMQSGKVKRELIEVLSVNPFLGESDMPYKAPNLRLLANKSKEEQTELLVRVTELSEKLHDAIDHETPLVISLTLLTALRVHEQALQNQADSR